MLRTLILSCVATLSHSESLLSTLTPVKENRAVITVERTLIQTACKNWLKINSAQNILWLYKCPAWSGCWLVGFSKYLLSEHLTVSPLVHYVWQDRLVTKSRGFEVENNWVQISPAPFMPSQGGYTIFVWVAVRNKCKSLRIVHVIEGVLYMMVF